MQGLVFPKAIEFIKSSLSLWYNYRISLTSSHWLSDIFKSKGANSNREVSLESEIQVLIKIPFKGYNAKFSAILSTIITLEISLPNLDKSLR